MSLKSKTQQRYMEFLKSKGKIPKAMAEGGVVDGEDEWSDQDWNDHEDTSGEPEEYMAHGGMAGGDCYAFGGEVHAPEHGDEGQPEMDEGEVKKRLAMALMKRKQLKPGA